MTHVCTMAPRFTWVLRYKLRSSGLHSKCFKAHLAVISPAPERGHFERIKHNLTAVMSHFYSPKPMGHSKKRQPCQHMPLHKRKATVTLKG